MPVGVRIGDRAEKLAWARSVIGARAVNEGWQADSAALVDHLGGQAGLVIETPVALPVRTHPVSSRSLGDGRAVSCLSAAPDGTLVGELRYQFLTRGILVELSATSTDLSSLGAGMRLFDETAAGIVLEQVEGAQE